MIYVSITETAELLNVHPNTVRNLIKQGILPFYQVRKGSKVLIPKNVIEELYEKNTRTRD